MFLKEILMINYKLFSIGYNYKLIIIKFNLNKISLI